MRHRGCITDPLAREWWRDYQAFIRDGNVLAIPFVEYVSMRLASLGARTVTSALSSDAPWYMSTCGHSHAWGAPCSSWTDA